MTIKKSIKYIVLAALFLIPFFPLIVANPFFFPFITGKAFFFRILVEIAFFGWIILAFMDARYRPTFTPLTIGITLFALVALLADLLGVSVLRSIWSNFERMEGWLVIAHLWAFFMVATCMFGAGEEGKRMWHRWLNVSIAVAVVTGLYGLGQLIGWFPTHQGSRVDASLGNSAYMAVYMLMHAGIVAYLFLVARSKQIAGYTFLTWAYPVVAVVFGFLVVATATRGTTLGLIGAIILTCALYAILGKNEPTKLRWISVGVIGLIIVVGIVFWTNRNATFIQNNEVLRRMASISLSDTSNQARQYIWPMAISGALERPILGWGQENFNYIFNKDYNPLMWRHEQWFDRAHNVFLDWFVASGFVGLIVYLALYVLLLVAVWRSDLTIGQKSVLTGLIGGYAVHNIFVFDNLASYVFFFALLGFGSSVTRRGASPAEHTSGFSRWLNTKTFSLDAVEYIVAPVSIVVLVVALYFLNVRPMQANTRLITALTSCRGGAAVPDPSLFSKALAVDSYLANQEIREQALGCSNGVINSQLPGQVKENFFELAMRAITDQQASTPSDARIYVLAGSFLSSIGQRDDAEKNLLRAHELSPRKQTVTVQLASVYLNKGEFDKSLALLTEAYESDPTYPDAKNAYLIALIASGNETKARTLFGSTPELFETEMAARAYVAAKQYSTAISIYKKLIAADAKNVDLRGQLAQVYYQADMIWLAAETMRAIGVDFPQYKAQVEAAIKQIQAPKK